MSAARVKGDGARERAAQLAARFARYRQRVVDAEARACVLLGAADERLRVDFESAFSGAGDAVDIGEVRGEFRRAGILVVGDYRSAPWLKRHAADLALSLKARAFATDALDHATGAPIPGLSPTSRAALLEAVGRMRARGVDVVPVGAPGIRDPIRRAEAVARRIPSSVPTLAPTLAFIGEHLVTSPPVRARFPGPPSLVFDRLPSRVSIDAAAGRLFRLRPSRSAPHFLWPLHPPALKVQSFVAADDPAFDIDPCRLDAAFRDALRDLKRVFGVAAPLDVARTRVMSPFTANLWRVLLKNAPAEVRAIWAVLSRGDSLALPHFSLVVLGAPSREHIFEEIVHLFRARLAPPSPISETVGGQFIEHVVQEALGFAASCIANPRRKVPTIASLLVSARAIARPVLAALRSREIPRLTVRIHRDDWNAAIHAVGYFIGRRIESPRAFQRLLRAPTDDAPSLICDLLRARGPSET